MAWKRTASATSSTIRFQPASKVGRHVVWRLFWITLFSLISLQDGMEVCYPEDAEFELSVEHEEVRIRGDYGVDSLPYRKVEYGDVLGVSARCSRGWNEFE